MPQLPAEVRKPPQHRDQATEPRVRRAQLSATTGHEQHAEEYREQQESDSGLVVQADSSQQASEEPQLGAVVAQRVPDHQEHGCPGESVKRGSTEAMTQRHGDHRHGHRAGGQQLGRSATTEQAGKRCGTDNKQKRRDHARQPEHEEVMRRQFRSNPREQWGKCRLVRITPREPLAG
jgi:hypothetical protein